MSIINFENKKRFSLRLCLTVLIAVLFITGTVFADDDVPGMVPSESSALVEESPAAQDGEATAPAESTPDATEPAAAVEETPAPDAQETAAPESTETATDEPVITETPAVTETLAVDIAEASAETGVEVVDSAGAALDLASQESAELTSSGDPYWKVGAKYYSVAASESGCYTGTSVAAGTCWISSTPITTALSKIEENNGALLPSDKKLYVLTGTYDGDVNFSGTVLTKMTGLIGVDGSSNITITGNVTLDGMAAGFTLSGFTITGSVSIVNSKGNLTISDVNAESSDGNGLGIGNESTSHSGNVTVRDSSFNNSHISGAIISTTGSVTVTNSTFSGNGDEENTGYQAGLRIITTGVVTLNGVTANSNYGAGIDVSNFSSLTMKNVISNSNTTNDYSIDDPECGKGIYIASGAAAKVTLENVDADSNEGYGIQIETLGIVSLKNMQANNNDYTGIFVKTPLAVTINSAQTNANAFCGIEISSRGVVTLTTIEASDNSDTGLDVNGYQGTYPTSVTLNSKTSGNSTTANYFNNNDENGVSIMSKGAITLSNFDANSNSGTGVYLNNCLLDSETGLCQGNGNITLNVTIPNWSNGLTSNEGYGLQISSKGNVSLTGVAIEESERMGMYIDAWGTITLSNVSSTGNGGQGAILENTHLANKAVTVTGSTFSDNENSGLFVNSMGVITLNGVTSNGNTGYGAYLDNTNMAGKTVTVTDSTFSENDNTGLFVLSKGAITLNGNTASSNHSPVSGTLTVIPGSVVDSIESGATEKWSLNGKGSTLDITLSSDDFDGTLELRNEDGDLLESVSGSGTITISSYLLADDTGYQIWVTGNSTGSAAFYTLSVGDEDLANAIYPGSGAELNNSSATAAVSLNGSSTNSYNTFDGNANYGLKVISLGAITINNTSAGSNTRDGLHLNNPTSSGVVTISDKNGKGSFSQNGEVGLNVRTKANILLSGVSAGVNGLGGIDLDNCLYDEGTSLCTGTGLVTIVKSSAVSNEMMGIEVDSNGNISLTDVTANENNEYGISLNNKYALGNITLKNVTTENNNNTGINIHTNGQVTLGAITARHNFKTGGYLSVEGAISDLYNDDVGEEYWGFNATEGETYTFRLQEYNGSMFMGVLSLYDSSDTELVFDSVSGTGTSSITATWTANADGYYHLVVANSDDASTYYQLSLNNSDFSNIKEYEVKGVEIDAGKNVTFSGTAASNLSHNSTIGLYISTEGTIALLNTKASSNGLIGAVLNNAGGSGNVTVAGSNNDNRCGFNENGSRGLEISTSGTISLNYLNAFSNVSDGIYMRNQSSATAKAFTFKNVDTIANGGNGFYAINDLGAIQISNINSSNNTYNGVYLLAGNGVTTISGENHLWNNSGVGLTIETRDVVTLSGLDIQRNGQAGISIASDGTGLITLTNIFLKNSGGDGIYIVTNGAVTLTGVVSLSNGKSSNSTGLYLVTDPTQLVTIKNSAFMDNGAQGIYLGYRGADWLKPNILTTVYFGNDVDGHGEGNLLIEYVSP